MNPAEFANIAHAERRLWWYRGMNRILFRFLPGVVGPYPMNRVLEAGCGTGYLSSLLEERGCQMHAVDLDPAGLRYARGMGLQRIACADVLRLPFPDKAFDAVISMDVLVHMAPGEEQKAIDEFARVLRPGGLMLVRVAAFDLLRSSHSIFVGEKQRYTRPKLLRLARNAGVTPIRCTYLNSILLPVALAKFRIWEPLTGQQPSSGVAPVHPVLDRLLYSALAVEAKLVSWGINLPLGQSVLLAARKPAAAAPDNNRAHTVASPAAGRESS